METERADARQITLGVRPPSQENGDDERSAPEYAPLTPTRWHSVWGGVGAHGGSVRRTRSAVYIIFRIFIFRYIIYYSEMNQSIEDIVRVAVYSIVLLKLSTIHWLQGRMKRLVFA